MTLLVKITLSAAILLSIIIPLVAFFLGERNKRRYKKSLALNCVLFFGTMVITTILMYNGNVQAAETTSAASSAGFAYVGAALSVGLACIGGGIAVASAASAALGALSEDSSLLGKSLIYVGLAEGVCLYGLIIAFMILGKV